MPVTIQIRDRDLRAWQAALADYAAVTHRSLEEVAVIKAREVLFYASSYLQQTYGVGDATSSRKGMDLTAGDESTCALVAWLLRKKAEAGKIRGLGSIDAKGRRIARTFAGRGKNKGKTKTELLGRGARFYTRAYARQWARQQTRVRKSHRKFVLTLPIKAANALAEKARAMGIDVSLGKSPRKPSARQIAVDGTATAITLRKAGNRTAIALDTRYRFRSSHSLANQPIDETARDYQRMIDEALPAGLRASLANIQVYLKRKWAQLSKK